MILDFNYQDISNNAVDYCIVGSGPAGLTLAMDLAKTGKKIIILEGGSLNWSKESADCYKGINQGDDYYDLDVCRLRFFGGTSNHWTGWCRNLDSSDFYSKNISGVNWQINKADLDPYLDSACKILEVDSQFENKLLSKQFGVESQTFNFSPPVRFSKKYKHEIEQSKSITLLVNANLTNFIFDSSKVQYAEIQSFSNKKTFVSANEFILAAGGIENSRLLLWINKINKENLIHRNSPLGEYWMEHPVFYLGKAFVDRRWKDSYLGLNYLTRKKLGILNAGIRIEGIGDEGTTALIKDIMCVAPNLGKQIASQFKKNLVCAAEIRGAWEQKPNKENSITISNSEFDQFGIPRPILKWKKSKFDILTIRKTMQQVNAWIMHENLGRFKYNQWVLDAESFPYSREMGGFHHMGGTRMGRDLIDGVVDKNLKVFKKDNLHILGSSVFPTGGHANPTLTIVQLALRLSSHLKEKILN